MTTNFYKTLNFMVWCGGKGGGGGVSFEELSTDPIVLFQDYYCDLYIMSYLSNQNLKNKHTLKTIPFLQVY